MAAVRISKIAVLQSLPTGQLRTGARLREDIEAASAFHSRGLPVDFREARSRSEFWACLDDWCHEAQHEDECPLLHIECHGSTDTKGLSLSDGTDVTWAELKPRLTAMNLATRCNLLVVLGACYGGHLAQIIQVVDRAPCWAVIGPTADVLPGELMSGYGAFYREFLTSLSGDRAVDTVTSWPLASGRYYFIPAGGFFRVAYAKYLRDHCNPEALIHRAIRMQQKLKEMGVVAPPGVVQLRRKLRAVEQPSFEKHLRHFFMMDLYPENAARFPITLDDVKQLSRELSVSATQQAE